MPLFDTVCIVGVGLIGGSFGIALREKQLARQVVGAVRRQETINAAFQKGAVDNATTDLAQAVRDADLLLLAPPVGQMKALCEEIAPLLKEGAIVTDAGSTKADIVAECAPIFGEKAHFIGGHPMAGSERTGVENAQGNLFENATWILTPDATTPFTVITRMQQLVEGIGAKPLVLDPQTHDQLLAVSSHVPHITAAALVHLFDQTREQHSVVEQLIAGGWRDSTRVAAGSPEMWRDICLANAMPIGESLDDLIAELQKLRGLLSECKADEIGDVVRGCRSNPQKTRLFPQELGIDARATLPHLLSPTS
jgi:Prephenate dehydrogenase